MFAELACQYDQVSIDPSIKCNKQFTLHISALPHEKISVLVIVPWMDAENLQISWSDSRTLIQDTFRQSLPLSQFSFCMRLGKTLKTSPEWKLPLSVINLNMFSPSQQTKVRSH